MFQSTTYGCGKAVNVVLIIAVVRGDFRFRFTVASGGNFHLVERCWECGSFLAYSVTNKVAYMSTATYLYTHSVPQLSDFVPLSKD